MSGGAPRRLAIRGLQRLLAGAALGLVIGGVLWALRGVHAVRALEGPLLDVRTRWFAGGQAPDPDIVLVMVEDGDVRELQRDLSIEWPWPLAVNAQIFGFFADAGVRAVLVDVYHLDRGAGPDDIEGRHETGAADEAELAGEAQMAEEYAQALRRIGRVALAFQLDAEPKYEVPARASAIGTRLDMGGVLPGGGAYARAGANLPVRRVLEGAARLGFANLEPDPDGVVRRASLAGRWSERPVPSLALAGAQLLLGPGTRDSKGRFVVDGRPVPTDAAGSFLVDFRNARPKSSYASVSPARVLQWQRAVAKDGQVPAEARAALAGKTVIWGVNLSGADDIVSTPIGAATDGPELQATILDNLLHGGGRVPATPLVSLAWILGLCGLTGLVTLGSKRKHLPHVIAFGVVLATVAVAVFAFGRGTALDLFTPLVGVFLTWGGATTVKLLTEGRYNKWLEGTFSRYLAPSVIDALKQDPRLLELGGVEREVTVLFSDIAGFTGLSELLEPPQLVQLLNVYLTAHCDAVFAHGGVVDKFIGDAVMAFYGDPIPQPDHALRACRTALDVRAALPALEPVWRGMHLPHFDMRIGLNSGRAVLGNMGSQQRFSYTAMGDTVNLASRLEGANKAFGTHILLGEATYQAARDGVLAKPLARLGVVGRDEPALVYELVALRERATPEQVRHVEAFVRAQSAARTGDLAAARKALAEAEALRPGDGACAWFRTVLDGMAAGAEPSPWSGVVRLTGK